MKWKKVTALTLTAAMVIPACLGSIGTIEARAEGMVTEAELQENGTASPEADDVVPNAYQYEYQKDELAAFCHFGMNTFTEIEWGDGTESPSSITLTTPIDADNYVKTLKEAGFKKLIITAKHHDGFCIWKSAYTNHDIEATNYPGDVLEDFSTACTKYDMDMGLYLSPWDRNSKEFGYYDKNRNRLAWKDGNGIYTKDGITWEEVEEQDIDDYNEYYDNQLREILSNDKYGNNGVFKEVWMDGANGDETGIQYYNFNKWYNTIQEYEGKAAGREADCMVFGMDGYTTVRWIGNENGLANEETWSKSKSTPFTTYVINSNNGGKTNANSTNTTPNYTKGYPDGNQWTVPEVDAKLNDGWFWNTGQPTKSLEELSNMYFNSVGHNAALLLNVPLNNQGKADTVDLERVTEFGTAIKNTFKTNYAANGTLSASEVRGNDIAYSPQNLVDGDDDTYWTVNDGTTTGIIEIPLGATRNIDVVSIEEAIQFGQRITGFKVEYSNEGGAWGTFDEGTTIGAKRLCRRAPVKADKVRISIKGTTSGVPILSQVGVYKASEGFETSLSVPECLTFVNQDDKDLADGNGFTYTGWTQENKDSMLGGNGMYANAGAEFTFTFTGTKAWLFGTMGDANHGTADIYLDGSSEVAKTIDAGGSSRKVNQVIYETPDLEYGQHTIRLVARTKATGIQGAAVLANEGQGMFEFAQSDYQVAEGVDDFVELTVKRIGGSQGTVSVQFEVNSGSAMQADFDADARTTLVFADGETEKKVRVAIYRNSTDEHTLEDFTAEILPVQGAEVQAAIGFIGKSTVTIYESQEQTAQELLDIIGLAKKLESGLYTSATYAPMRIALNKAKAVASDMNATEEEWTAAKEELQTAVDALVFREQFSENDRFVMPSTVDETSRAEAEFFILDSSKAQPTHEVRYTNVDKASNGKIVSWFDEGNVISMPYTAKRAGTYTVTVSYLSGSLPSNPNKYIWKIDDGDETQVIAPPTPENTYDTIDFDIEIPQAGDGILYFRADASRSPNTDYFDFRAKKLETGTFSITANAGEHGSISDAGVTDVAGGTDKTYTITPDKGYEVDDVQVNGVSVGAVTSYTFSNIQGDAEISATFKFAYFTEGNPAVLSGSGETMIEAEYFELVPIATDKYVRITTRESASNGKEVNYFEEGNKIKLAFNAEQAGTYKVKATYRSGRVQGTNDPNAFEWSGTNVNTGSLDVYGENGATSFHTAEFNIEVAEAGAGELVFTASGKAGPVIDKFVFERQEEPAVVPVTGVTLDKTKETLTSKGASIQLKETIAPANATNKNVTWKSSDTNVATVNASGLVTAVANGEADITVTTEDGKKTAACKVKVEIPAGVVSVTGVTLDKTKETLTSKGASIQLKETIAPANATNKTVTWKSSDINVATVNASGLVTAVANGEADITVTTEDGKKTAVCTVTVVIPAIEDVRVTGVNLNSTTLIMDKIGQTASLTASVEPANASNRRVSWTSSNTKVAAVDAAGKVTAVGAGTADITVTTEDGGFKAACKVTVKEPQPEKPGKVTGVKTSSYKTTAFTVTWEKQDGADSYRVYLQTGKKWGKARTAKSNKLTIKKLKSGTKYAVRVEAVNKQGTGEKSEIFKTATKPAKTSIKLNAAGKSAVKVTLKKVKGAKYQVWMQEGKGKFKKVKTLGKTAYTQKKLKPGKKYTFKVRTFVKNGAVTVYGNYSKKSITLKK